MEKVPFRSRREKESGELSGDGVEDVAPAHDEYGKWVDRTGTKKDEEKEGVETREET